MLEQDIKLANRFLQMTIAPQLGGAITRLTTASGKEVLHTMSPTKQKRKDILGSSLFVELPYTQTIQGGQFTYWGVLRKVPANHPSTKDPIFGDGWKARWTVVESSDNKVTLAFNHPQKTKGLPFTYQAQITYSLQDNILTIEAQVTNLGMLPMPCGLGIHPFFVKSPNVRMAFKSKHVWTHNADPITQPYKTPAIWCFEQAKALPESPTHICFGGFGQEACVSYPTLGLDVRVQTDPIFNHVALHVPEHSHTFSLVPMTMTNNAFNKAAMGIIGTGIRSLGQNETLSGQIKFIVNEKSTGQAVKNRL